MSPNFHWFFWKNRSQLMQTCSRGLFFLNYQRTFLCEALPKKDLIFLWDKVPRHVAKKVQEKRGSVFRPWSPRKTTLPPVRKSCHQICHSVDCWKGSFGHKIYVTAKQQSMRSRKYGRNCRWTTCENWVTRFRRIGVALSLREETQSSDELFFA